MLWKLLKLFETVSIVAVIWLLGCIVVDLLGRRKGEEKK